jgi:hypothetical protein
MRRGQMRMTYAVVRGLLLARGHDDGCVLREFESFLCWKKSGRMEKVLKLEGGRSVEVEK